MKKSILLSIIFLSAFVQLSLSDNPIKPYVGMADPHIFIFENKAYLFSTRDIDSTVHKFVMPEWNIWSSDDLVKWKHERTLFPKDTYMGVSNNCWATDHAFKNGKYYFYFSNGNVNTGVMVADSPAGPYKDVLGKPLLDVDLTSTKEYDPSVLIDDDGKAYLIFGHYRKTEPALKYYIVDLNEDMISFSGQPKLVEIIGDANVLTGNDKPNLHKRNGIYYLSAGTHYATSKSIYGPYARVGSTGNGIYGLDSRAHGNFFEWKNQWFQTWCNFHLGKEVAHYRESYITYLHYKDNGEMIADTTFLKKHFKTGVGQFNAKWDKIEAEWYMAATNVEKRDKKSGGFEIQNINSKSTLCYPNIEGLAKSSKISFSVSTQVSGKINIYSDTDRTKLLASVKVPKSTSKAYIVVNAKLKNHSNAKGICLTFEGKGKDLMHLDWLKFD